MISTEPIPAAFVRGALEIETTEHGIKPHRLAAAARAQAGCDAHLPMVESQCPGVPLAVNMVNPDPMRLRAVGPAVHGFLNTIWNKHPDTPCWWSRPYSAASMNKPPGRGL